MPSQGVKLLGIGASLLVAALFLFSVFNVSNDLNAIEAEASSREGRFNRCVRLAGEEGVPAKDQVQLCNCVVDKASEREITKSHGRYDEDGVIAVINSCVWQLGL